MDTVTGGTELMPVAGRLQPGIDRRLGYFGEDRFVSFYYEPRGEEVIWRDSRSYGFGTGAWSTFLDEVTPLAARQQVDVGSSGSAARHVLVIDRMTQEAFFVERGVARRLLGGKHSKPA